MSAAMNTPLDVKIDIKKGLEGVIADSTAISLVEGDIGRLSYRGYTVEDLLARPFVDAAYLIVFGELPDAAQHSAFEEFLWQAGQLPANTQALIAQLSLTAAHPMEILQAITPVLGLEPPTLSMGNTAEQQAGLVIAARLPAALAMIHGTRHNLPMSYPTSRRYGERYLQLITGKQPTSTAVEVFERTQLLQLDHSFNASTFTARVVTSTLAPISSALAAALGALYGPLHGRADQAALEMAEEVGAASRAAEYVADCLARKQVVMGMGHREYRVVDPRAKVIKALAQQIAVEPEHRRLLDTLVAIEDAFVEQTSLRARAMRANLEFYKGLVYSALGLRKEYFTASFSAARVFGWLAHSIEQRQDNRIIRPAAHYIGPAPRALPRS
jgi:citrate synthase